MNIEYLRSYRFLGIALFDLISSFIGFFIIDLIFNFKNKKAWYLSVIPIGIVTHIAFSQKTHLNSKLFSKDLNVLQIFVVLNVVLLINNLEK